MKKCQPLVLIDAPVFDGSNYTAARESSVGRGLTDWRLIVSNGASAGEMEQICGRDAA